MTLTHFDTDADRGLTADEASRRLDEHGPNQLPEPPAPNPVLRFLSHFNDVLIYVLLVAAVVTAFMGHWVDTIVIAAVAVVNATIGYLQEGQAEKALQGIRDMLSPVPPCVGTAGGSRWTPQTSYPATSCGCAAATASRPPRGHG